MEARLTSTVSAPSLAPARVETAPVRAAVRTDLIPPQAVAAQAGAEQTRFGRRDQQSHNAGAGKNSASSFDLDRETGELIYKVIDQETQSVLSQYPYASILQLRAYLKSQDEGS